LRSARFKIHIDRILRYKIFNWSRRFSYFVYFNPNDHVSPHGPFSHQLFVGNKSALNHSNSLTELQASLNSAQFHVGYLSYELKDEIEDLKSENRSTIPVAHLDFFVPDVRIVFDNGSVTIESEEYPERIWAEIQQENETFENQGSEKFEIRCRTTKDRYLENCRKIKEDIINGEYYELNYCIEYYIDNCVISPIQKYLQLNDLSPMPFSCLAKFANTYVLCASPERFMKKEGPLLVSQPIKGTIRRGKDEPEDQQLKTILRNSQKEIAENMMIVDLVRNDLSKSSKTGTVRVEEFFGIYTFKQVHQMISTVTSKARDDLSATQILKNAFPMGSMTGAPKIRVMKAIEQYEDSQRGIYSGSIGWISPKEDFDFNVVIRSIVYDQRNKRLSFHVGSAITYDADPEYEYEECLLKAKNMMEILTQ